MILLVTQTIRSMGNLHSPFVNTRFEDLIKMNRFSK